MSKLAVYNVKDDSFNSVEEPDPPVRYTYADFLEWQYDERLEICKGRMFRLPTPATRHRKISRNINAVFFTIVKKTPCQFFAAPFGCYRNFY